MKRILVAFALMLAVILAFTACDMLPGNEPKEDVITVEDGYLVVNGVKTEHEVNTDDVIEVVDGYVVVNGVKTEIKADDGTCDHTPEPDVIEVADGYLVVNGVKTEHKVYTEPVLSVIDGYVAVNGVKTEYKVYAEPELSVIDGYVAVNGVKTAYKVYTDPVISVIDGYVAVNGVKTEYEVSKGCEHIWETATTYPTCTEEGYDTMTCSLCDKVVVTNKTEKLEHNYATTYTIDDNYHWFKCTGCDAVDGKEMHTPDAEDNCSVCGIPLTETPGVVYDVSTDGTYAEVIAYEGTAKKVKIASEYKGLPVKNIYADAFENNRTITDVIIPDSVTRIGDDAFEGCSSLTSVTIGNGVTYIGISAFEGCSSLASVTIPDSVICIGDSAFSNCNSALYTEYEYGKYVCTNDNPYLILVALTNDNFSTYKIHEDTKFIDTNVFHSCQRLTSITIPDGVTSIGSYAFAWCSSLTSVTIPDSVTRIGDNAFYSCSSLTSVTIGNGVTSIGNDTFEYCSSLTSVTIGNSVTSIVSYAFAWCSSLTSINYDGTIDEWNSISKGSYWNYNTGNYTIYCTDGEIQK